MATSTATPARSSQRPTDDWDKVPKCGHGVNTSKGSKPCVKPAGHDQDGSPALEAFGSGHASRIYAKKERKPVSLKTIQTLEEVPHDETVSYGAGRGREGRDEVQQAVDAHVVAAYAKWAEAGKPKLSFNEMIRDGFASRYFVTEDDEDSVRAMLRSAGRFQKPEISVRIAPLKHDQKGRGMIYWIAVDVVQHSKTNAETSVQENVS